MHVSNRPSIRIAAAAAGVTIAATGCGSGSDSAQPTATASASASASASVSVSASASASSSAPARAAEGKQCGGMSIDHEANITRSTEIVINAPLKKVWDVHTDVESWDKWQDAVLTVKRLDSGDFASDSRFRWTTPVPKSQFAPADTLKITSSVKQLEPGKCVLWDGPAIGKAITIEKGTHLWMFTETDGKTLVHTEESWDAALLDALKGPDHDAVAAMLGGGLDVWLKALKTEVETSKDGDS
ncbi:SRPBCC family protein [Nonomuraea sp. NPDC050404]|uniref:SRPBCC family protein n=1 Tax=Nonomuraea sp. NPDC050404 TaxID=3155783 RepID=UPI0033E4FB52